MNTSPGLLPNLPSTVRDGFSASIGNTPLIRLHGPSEATGCNILGKAEFLNPGGSVKDRAARAIVEDAERQGLLKPGGTIVEGTAGNTGIGLALVGNAKGYHTVIVMPETQSQEKKDTIKLCGAELRLVPALPYKDPGNYIRVSELVANELAKTEPNGAVWANQFDNTANMRGHYETTGPEIWEQTGGEIDAFTCAIGTGGTIAGVGRALKERREDIQIVLSDPDGSAIHNWVKHGELKAEGDSITEGIGQGRITKNIEQAKIDDTEKIPDTEAMQVVFDLIRTDGLIMGGSSGINVAGAIRIAKRLGPGHTIVTILCDLGQRYQSKIFNPEFLRSKGLPVPDFLTAEPKRG
ncbi:MAG: cysteine synthase A [Alphaproteobacteria bacterium]|nr:cysteine synthase A [Alphaproteobacteria bacterium SS10]